MDTKVLYDLWCEKVTDPALRAELLEIDGDEEKISDRFYQLLTFGTGGLRGVIGAGTNRMNIHTVGLATQALAEWVKENNSEAKGVAIGYDSRHMSYEMAHASAAILAANGIKAYIYDELEPTPLTSFAVIKLGCAAGIVITASHNPAKYNGFKCYGPEGYQMTDEDAHDVEKIMGRLDIFDDVNFGDYAQLLSEGLIVELGEDMVDSFIDSVMSCQVNKDATAKAGMKIIYTPLFGAGLKPVCKALKRAGIDGLRVVESQSTPNGDFPGLVRPNPEERASFDEAIKMSADSPAELLLATAPDCDRVGIAVREGDGFELLSGNEVGVLMLNYLLSERKNNGTLSAEPVAIKSIVSTALADKVAELHGCSVRSVLTGFKYIGEIIAELDAKGESERYVMGFEESYGYLCGNHSRDKDAVVASLIICEMASFYKLQGKSLLDVLRGIYDKCGWYRHRLVNLEFEGGQTGERMRDEIMNWQRTHSPETFAGTKVVSKTDYEQHSYSAGHLLPPSNVLQFDLDDDCVVIARPSGTEPKLKFYLTACKASIAESEARLDELVEAVYAIAKESVGYER